MMRSPAPVLRLFVSAFVTLAPLVIGGCSSSSSSSPAPASPPATTGTATALSTSYTSNACASCHGADGSMTTITPKVLKGTTLTAAAYSAAIRSGRSGTSMIAYTAAKMSDADIANDYAFFTKK